MRGFVSIPMFGLNGFIVRKQKMRGMKQDRLSRLDAPATLWRPQRRVRLFTNNTTTNHFKDLPIYLDTVLLEDLSRSFRDALE
jgi:hypothetical protein